MAYLPDSPPLHTNPKRKPERDNALPRWRFGFVFSPPDFDSCGVRIIPLSGFQLEPPNWFFVPALRGCASLLPDPCGHNPLGEFSRPAQQLVRTQVGTTKKFSGSPRRNEKLERVRFTELFEIRLSLRRILLYS